MKKEISFSNRKRNIVVLALIASVVVVCMVSYAWFYNNRHLSTFTHVESPSTLAIKGGNETTIEQIDLSTVDLSSDSHKASFVFCVTGSGSEDYKLELAYTTYVPFKYSICQTNQTKEQPTTGDFLTHKDNTGTYFYSTGGTPLEGKYVNQDMDTKIANDTKHQEAYDTYPIGHVQKHAEPLYYLTEGITVRNFDSNNNKFVDYYILELTWEAGDVTDYPKETDLVYLLAANQGNQENQ